MQWLQRRDPARPFFLYVPFTAIHVPIEEPEKWLQANAHLADPAQRLRAACASHLDDALGQILAVLDRRHLRANTLVVFLSDNGAHPPGPNQGGPYPGDFGPLKVGNDNLPWRGHKGGVYEGGIRTPGVAHWAGKLAPGELRVPLHAVDWMPTLCALAGAKPAGDLKWDGTDVWPLLVRTDRSPAPRTIYTAGTGFRSAAVRHGDWKLIVNRGDAARKGAKQPAAEELYNLATDPGETRNLAAERPDLLADLKRRLAEVSARDRDAIAEK